MKQLETYPQNTFLKHLARYIAPEEKLRPWLAELLGLSPSAVGRRISNETSFTMDELATIAMAVPEAARIALSFLPQRKMNLWDDYSFRNEDELLVYLKQIRRMLQEALDSKERLELKYLARDLPLFWFLADPNLMDYKFSYWTGALQRAGLQRLKGQHHRLGTEIFQCYSCIPSTELWASNVLEEQRKQLQIASAQGWLSEGQAETLRNTLDEIPKRLAPWGSLGHKDPGVAWRMALCPQVTMNNAGMLQRGNHKTLIGAWTNAQLIASNDPRTIEIFENDWWSHERCADQWPKPGVHFE